MLRAFLQELGPMLRLCAPLVVAELGWTAMVLVDTIMVGRLPNSAEAIGGAGVGGHTFYAVGIFGLGMVMGMETLVSQAFGAGRIGDCHRTLLNGIYLALAIAPPCMAVVHWVIPPMLPWIGVQPAVIEQVLLFQNALNWSTPPLFVYFAARRYLQSMNLAAPIMFAAISANVVNACCDWVLIFGHLGAPAMGVAGSGWATVIARTYQAAVLVGYALYYDHKHQTGLRAVPLRPDWPRLRRLVKLGLPAAGQLTIEVAVFALASALIARLAPAWLAGHEIALQAASATFMVPLGISAAASVRVGQAIGRGDAAGASRAGWTALGLGAAFMTGAGLSFVLLPSHIARVFSPDPEVIAAGVTILFVAAFFQLFDGLQIVATGALRGAGDTHTAFFCHLLGYWALGLPVGYYLCFGLDWGAPGLWVGLSLALITIGLILFLAWRRAERGFARLRPLAAAATN